MLTKKQFINAMKFFDEFDHFKDRFTKAMSSFFDGNGLLFIGCDDLHERYLELLKIAMEIDPKDQYDPITYWLYEANENIYDEPNDQGICKCIGKADKKFWDVEIGNKKLHIENTSDLYDCIVLENEYYKK